MHRICHLHVHRSAVRQRDLIDMVNTGVWSLARICRFCIAGSLFICSQIFAQEGYAGSFQPSDSAIGPAANALLLGDQAVRGGRYSDGIKHLTSAISHDELRGKNLVKAYSTRAFAYIHLQIFDGALEDLNKAVGLAPNHPWVLQRRCWTNAQLHNFLSARRDCDRAAWASEQAEWESQYKALFAVIRNSKAEIYFQMGEYDKAIQEYDRALKVSEDDYIYENRGNARYYDGDYAGAIFDYSIVINKIKEQQGDIMKLAKMFWKRGNTYFDHKRLKDAAADFAAAASFDSNDPTYLNSLCWTHAKLGTPDDGIESCNRAVSIDPKEKAYWDSQAFAYYKMEKYEEALKSANQALRINKEFNWSLYHRGLINERLGRVHLAKQDFEHLFKISPKWRIAKDVYERYGLNK